MAEIRRAEIEAMDDGTFTVTLWPKEEKKKEGEEKGIAFREPKRLTAKSLDEAVGKIKGGDALKTEKRGEMAKTLGLDK